MTSYSIEILAVTASMLERIKELLGFPSPATPSETTHAIPAELAALNNGGLDWRIYRYDGWLLTLAANNTLAYGHSLELRFHSVAYIRCPTIFDSPCFRNASTDELTDLKSFLDLTGETAYFFDAQASNTMEAMPFVVCAESFSIHHEPVSYIPVVSE